MDLLAAVIEATLKQLFENGIIDWYPDDIEDRPESFQAECEIECSGSVIIVTMCDWYIFLWWNNGGWEAYYSMSTTIVPCNGCEAKFPMNELRGGLCDVCQDPFPFVVQKEGALL